MKKHDSEFTSTFYRHNHLNFIATLVILVFNAGMMLGVAFLLEWAMDTAIEGSLERLGKLTIIAVGYLFAMIAGWLLDRYFKNRFMEKAMRQYKSYIFEKMAQKHIGSFAEESTSLYLSSLTNDINSIEQNYLEGTFGLLINILFFVGSITLMGIYNWKLTMIAAVLGFGSLFISARVGQRLQKTETNVSQSNEGFTAMVRDLLGGFSVIKSFKAEVEAQKLFDKSNGTLEKAKCYRRRTAMLIGTIGNAMSVIIQVSLIMTGVYFVVAGEETIGVIVGFVQLLNFMVNPAQFIPAQYANRKASAQLIRRIAKALSRNNKASGDKQLGQLNKGISIEHVSFGYEEAHTILQDVSLNFEKGKSYAIVGASGSGKSTLLNLLMKNHENYKGSIYMDQVELRDLAPDSAYDLLSLIQQNVFVFDSTIEENITMFKQFDEKTVQSAIWRAGLQPLIEERGSSYICGENGKGLSGGEKQRISIARALLRNSQVLLMDEATAALDSATAYMVEDAILSVKDLTRIVVTHKLEEKLLARYDEIIVLADGKIVEQGSFDKLLLEDGYFKALYSVSHAA